MLKKIYEKNEIWFSILWIIIYSVGYSVSESISKKIGIEGVITVIFTICLSVLLFCWIKRNGLLEKYGLCKAKVEAKHFLFFIPLAIISTHNFWNGFGMNFPLVDTICYIGGMLCVGFLEEVLFRGLLFKAIGKEDIKTAIIISSVTFGLAHLVHLFDGSGMTLVANMCQVFGAVAIGFLFVIIFYRGGSLIPCIITHSLYDAFSAFGNGVGITPQFLITINILQVIVIVIYAVIICKTTKSHSIIKQ